MNPIVTTQNTTPPSPTGSGEEAVSKATTLDGNAQPPINPELASIGDAISGISTPEPGFFADLEALRLTQDFAAMAGITSPLLRVPIRRPAKTSFNRVHPDEGFRLSTTLIALKEEGEFYLVAPALRHHLVTEATFGAYGLFLTLSRPGDVLGLWPIRLPGPDGRLDSWNRSALEIATGVATKHWSRVLSDRALGAYTAHVAPASSAWGEPRWPALAFDKILDVAFRGRIISDLNHAVLRRLRGEI